MNELAPFISAPLPYRLMNYNDLDTLSNAPCDNPHCVVVFSCHRAVWDVPPGLAIIYA